MNNSSIPARKASVEMIKGRPMIVINGETYYPMIHSLTDVPSGRWSWEELPQHNIRNFGKHGVRLFQLDVFLEHIWKDEDTFDLTIPCKQIAGVLEVCPEASIFFRFHLRAPRWWMKRHPEEWVVYADTDYREEQEYGLLRIIEHDNNPVRRVSMASRKWRDAVSKKFIQFLKEFSATPEASALAGIQVANGVYGEWHNWGFFDNEPDISEPMNVAFREWLRQKYHSEANLREAWGNPAATFDKATSPDMEKRATRGIFRDPVRQRDVIDYYTCMHETVADNIIHFTRLLKEHWPRPIISGTFYGYYFSTFGRQAAGGHLALHKILTEPSIDYLSGPQAYEPEAIELGDPYRSRSLITSVRLHGKLWLDEMDVEPKIPILKDKDYDRRVQESVADVRRNAAFTYTKGMGFWFYDFNISGVDLDGYLHLLCGSQGNWDHPVVMRQIEQMKELFTKRSSERAYASEADVLFVYDTDSFAHTASLKDTDPVTPALIDHASLAAFRSGAVFDPVHIRDLDRVDLSPYRVVVFGNTFVLTAGQRAFIKDSVAKEGRHIIWHYAPGYIDETTTTKSADHIAELTGIQVKPANLKEPPQIRLEHSLGNLTYSLGSQPIDPLFSIVDEEAEIHATYEPSGKGAIAEKAFPDHTTWFVSLPSRNIEPIAGLLKRAGAHLYSESDAFFYAGGSILVLHTLSGGRQEITLKNGKRKTLSLPEGPATVLLDTETGDDLLNAYSPEWDAVRVLYQ